MTIEEFRKRDTSVTINGHVVELHFPIVQALEAGSLTLLRLDYFHMRSDDPLKGRNVVALDQHGNEVWRVEPFWYMVKARDRSRKVPDSYSHIRVGEDGKIYAYQPIGFICELDVKTGKILREEQTR